MTHPAITFLSNIRKAWQNPHTPWAARLLLLAGIAYVLIPMDLVPDVIPVIGWLDDMAILPAALFIFQRWTSRRARSPLAQA